MNETVLVVGLGDLGTRVLDALAAASEIQVLVGGSRNVERGSAQVAQAALIAQLYGGPRSVSFEWLDLDHRKSTVALLRRLDPALIVLTASRHTWWRPQSSDAVRVKELARLPYGAWLPVLVSTVRALMEAVRDAGIGARVVSLPLPDLTGPVLAPLGLAPHVGAGNVSEVAAKLQLLAARSKGVDRDDVRVRLVMHHAVERVAFGSFSGLGADGGEPPWLGEILVRGRELTQQQVAGFLRAPYPLAPGTGSHQLTAAATVQVVRALLSDSPCAIHVPSPGGLPGGYPATVGRAGVELDLPQGVSEPQAVEVNRQAARWDGVEAVEADGTIVFTHEVGEISQAVLGLRLTRVPPDMQADVANEMLERVEIFVA